MFIINSLFKASFVLLITLASFVVNATPFTVEQVTFDSNGDDLSASIVFPAKNELVAAVVFVHGSGPQTRNITLAERFASNGIAALVYDKRGVGQSGGDYESKQSVSGHNIDLLADDAKAALTFLANHSKTKSVNIGLAGISQAGWIVPIAAERILQKDERLDFMLLWSAPVCKVSEEDIFSKFTKDHDGAKTPSYQQALNAREQAYIWPDFLGRNSDPNVHLNRIHIPSLWIFGDQDGSIPVDLSASNLQKHIDAGKPFATIRFSDAGHNNIPQTFLTAVDWINQLAN